MAELKIALGAVADVASSQDVKDAVSGLQGHLEGMYSRGRSQPLRKPLAGANTLTLSSGQTSVVSLGRPPMGKVWSVASITILGGDDGTAVASLKGAMYIGDPEAVLLTQCEIPQQSIPFFDSFGFPDYWVHDQQALFVNFTASGAVSNQQVVVHAWVMEYNDDCVEMQVI